MFSDILVITDALVEPPSEVIPFRTITMICHDQLAMECLLHTTQEMKDIVYQWMKPRGMMDYVSYILSEWEWVDSVRLDVSKCYPNSVITDAIRIENQINLIKSIRSLAGK